MFQESNKLAIVFAGCDEELKYPSEDEKLSASMVICADGGLKICYDAGLVPDIAVGDFDSAGPFLIEKAKESGTKVYEYPKEKDETDLDIALKLAYRAGMKRCLVYGALGGRLDHELTNLLLLRRYAYMGMQVSLVGRKWRVEVLTHDFPCIFEGKVGYSISLIPLSDTLCGVRTKGMKYELHGEDMISGSSRGVSNIVSENEAEIDCATGEAAVIINWPLSALD